MNTCFIAPNNEGLKKLIDDLNKITSSEIRTNDVLLIITKNGTSEIMQKILEASGLQWHILPDETEKPAAQPASAEKKPDARPSITLFCKHCKQPFEAKRRDQLYCSKPDCQKAKDKAYKDAFEARKKKEGVEKPTPAPFMVAGMPADGDPLGDQDTQL